MANPWFETVAVVQRRAKRRLPGSVYGALVAGAEAGLTIHDNVATFSELGFAPHSSLDSCLLGLGHSSISELSPADLVIPDGFTRRLGG